MKKLSIFAPLIGIFLITLGAVSCSAMVDDLKNMKGEVPYTVQHYFEAVDSDDFILDESKDLVLKGITGKNTEVTPEDFEGFNLKEVENVKIESDGTAVAKVKYARNVVTVTYDPTGGRWGSTMKAQTYEGKYGATYTAPENPEKTNWNFHKWENLPDTPVLTYPAADVTYKALWLQTGARYTINHYLEVVDPENPGENSIFDEESGLYFQLYRFQIQAGAFDPAKLQADDPDTPDASEGEIDSRYLTTARAFVLDGFDSKEFEQKEIKADGSTVVNILYERKYINIGLNPEYGTWGDSEASTDVKTLTGKYGFAVDKTVLDEDDYKLTREDYEFERWDPEVPDTFPAFNQTVNANWKQVVAPYTVKYFFETVEQTDSDDFTKYVEDVTLRASLKGTIGEKTAAVAKYAEGFSRVDFAQSDITEDGKTVVNIYYKRNIVEFTLKAGADGKWSDNTNEKTISGKYGAAVPSVVEPVHTNSDWEFVGWNSAGGVLPATFPIPATAPDNNTVYTAVYAQDTASYIVRHFFEPLDCADSNNTSLYVEDAVYRDSLKGRIGTNTNAASKTVAGFTAQTFVQKTIAASNTEINIYYKRNTITYTFLANEGTWPESVTQKTVSGKFGAAVTVPDTTDLTYVTETNTYSFSGWSPSVPATFGSADASFRAQWQVHNAVYYLYIYVEEPNVTEFRLERSIKKNGTIGEFTNDDVEVRDGYTAEYQNAKILIDGSAKARIYYKLKEITYTFEPNGGKWKADSSESAKTLTGKYKTAVTVPTGTDIEKTDYALSGWTPEVPLTFGTVNATFTANWEKEYAAYTVKHYQEELNGTETVFKTDTLKGKIGANTAAQAQSDKEGFSVTHFDQAVIAEDGFTVVEVHYTRNLIELSFDPNDGKWAENDSTLGKIIKGKYGATVGNFGSVYRNDYAFGGWELVTASALLGSGSNAVPSTFPANNMQFKASWDYIGTDYYVTYKFEKLDGTYTNVVSEINAMIGENITSLSDSNGNAFEQGKTEAKIKINGNADASTNAAVLEKTITGFNPQTISQTLVNADGTTVVEVKYDRNHVSIYFDANGGKWTDHADNTIKQVDGIYGEAVTAPSTTLLAKQFYEFTGWDSTVPSTFPGSNTTLKAQWNQVSAAYTVKYYTENLDGEYVEDVLKRDVRTGALDSVTAVTAEDVTGFTKTITQAIVTADGSAEVLVKYARNTVTITYILDGGNWKSETTNPVSGKYGADVPVVGEVGKADYSFTGWSPALPTTFPSTDSSYTAQWNYVGTNYKVEYWFEKTDGTYEKKEASYPTLTKTGTSGSDTQAEYLTSTEPGFVATTITQKKINADGSTVVEVKYDRMEVTLTFNANGGTLTGNTTATGKYGTAVTKPANPTRENWVFKGWGTVGGTIPDTFPYASVTYAAVWEQTGAEYTVKYYYQNIEDDEYTEKASQRKTLTGSINTTTTVTADAVEGFNAAVITQATVAADGSAVVQVKYARKTITLNLAANGGVLSGGVATISGKFGAAVTHPADPTRADYVFAGWSPSIPDTFPAVPEASYAAQWSQNAAAYTVKYFYQNTTGSDYTENESQRKTFKGTIGQTTNVSASAVDGFEAPVVTQATIVANGSAVVQVKFDRKEITLTLNANGGTLAGSSEIKGRFGAAVTQPGDPTREDYRFDGWDITDGTLPSTFPDEDSEYTAKWVQTQAYYKVNHWIQQKDNTYVAIEDQVKGTIGETTDVAAVTDQPGFTAKPFEQKVIQASGTVVDIYYDRNKVTITFDVNGGYWTEDSSTANKVWANKVFQDTFENPGEVARNDYVFDGWSPALDAEYPSADKTYTAQWKYVGTSYTVKYRFEKTSYSGAANKYEIDESKTVKITAKAGETTQAAVLASAPAGFTAQTISQTTIAADGSTLVYVDYDRNNITLTLAPNGGVLAGAATISGKYGTAVTKPVNPTLEDYSFGGWSPVIPDTFPSADATYTAQWTKVNANYTVVTQVQNADGTYSTESSISKKGVIGNTTAETAADRTGFTKTITQATITADDKAVVTIKFNRKTVTYTFAPNGGTWSITNTVSGLYGAAVTVPNTNGLTKSGWVFNGWDKTVPAVFGAVNETFTAQWTSGITGAGTNTALSDIELTHSSGTFTVTIPYAGSWNYKWYIDGKLVSGLSGQSVTPSLTSGVHTIMVIAVENGMVSFNDSVTVKIN